MHTTDLTQIGKCHQVLAYVYAVDNVGMVTLSIYDPNTEHDAADGVRITFDTAHPHRVSPITHNIGIDGTTLHGFFRSTYLPKEPPPPDPA